MSTAAVEPLDVDPEPPVGQCHYVAHDGLCLVPVPALTARLSLCDEHRETVLEEVWRLRERDLVTMHDQIEWESANLRRLQRVRGNVTLRGKSWGYRYQLPTERFLPTKRVTRDKAGFATKRDAAAALNEALQVELAPLLGTVTELSRAARAMEDEKRLIRSQREMDVKELGRAARAESESLRREQERPRFVYYVQRPDGAIKIGTTWNMESRMSAFRNVSPVELLALHTGGRPAEAHLHRRFGAHRLDGEWFTPAAALLAHIEHVAAVAARRHAGDAPRLVALGGRSARPR